MWSESPDARLSQGDVIGDVVVGPHVFPRKALQKGTGKGGSEIWTPRAEAGAEFWLSKGAVVDVIIASHSCELDKNERKARVIVAPVISASSLEAAARKEVFEGRRRSLLPLPNLPVRGDAYVDLRLLASVDRASLLIEARLAQLDEEGLRHLHEGLIGFFIRKAVPAVPET